MKIVKGDMVFDKAGRLGKVVEHDPLQGKYSVAYRGEAYQEGRRLGVINGIDPSLRESYEAIIKEVRSKTDKEDRLETLKSHVTKLEADPKHFKLLGYLKAEEAFLMHSSKVQPSTYEFQKY